MDFGVCYFPTHDGMAPGDVAALVEERGQESLFFPDHSHVPAERETPWPAGDEIQQKYWQSHDLFVAMTHAVAATRRLRIGSAICLVVHRDPIITANQVASIDHLSGGRTIFGIGAGWNREELTNHGTDPRTRFRLMRERVLAMKEIWANEEASYKGEFVAFNRILCGPKPAQRPHPPIIIGGEGPTVLDRVLEYGDGWFPSYGDREDTFERIAELQARAERPIDIIMTGMPTEAAVIDRVAKAGARRALHWLPSGGRSTVERALERWEAAITDWNGG